MKAVRLAPGHSTPTVALNTYVHEWPDALDRTDHWWTTRSANPNGGHVGFEPSMTAVPDVVPS